MTRRLSKGLQIALLCVALTSAFIAGNVTGWMAHPANAAQEPSEFTVFWEAWDVVVQHFVDQDKIDFRNMTYGAIAGMLDTLGDQNHTAFFTPDVARLQANALEGSFEGIGAHVSMENDEFIIVAPIHGSPAAAAGILSGDRVLAVDGVSVQGMGEWEIIDRVRGTAGTPVTLTVIHADTTEAVDIVIVRERIELESVLWSPIPGTKLAYLQITQFAGDTNFELMKALREMQELPDTKKPQGILLDLRNNPGGYLLEAIRVGSQFLADDLVILHERNAEGKVATHRSRGRGYARELPLVVLINQGSASAAEILAGALQENQRAQLVGTTTLGTGTVLQQFNLSDGSVIRLGVTHWLTPDYHLIKNQGITPDVTINQPSTVPLVDATILRNWPNEQVATGEQISKSNEIKGTTAWSSEDRQFNSALLLLHLATLSQSIQE